MGRKNKPFIDKKNSTTYHFVRRSQRDVGAAEATSEELSEYVLQRAEPRYKDKTRHIVGDDNVLDLSDVPTVVTSSEKKKGMMQEVEENLRSLGLIDTTAEQYDRYTMEMGAGTYFSADTGHVAPSAHTKNDVLSKRVVDDLEDEIREVDRQLESIALTPKCMDDDVAQALFGDFDVGDFEEINDDFCIMADKEVAEHEIYEEVAEEEGTFDFDAHVKKLMEQAMREDRGFGDGYNPNVVPKGHYWKRGGEEDVFRNVKPLHMKHIQEEDEEEHDDLGDNDNSLDRELDALGDIDTTPGVVPALNPDEEKALCEKFEETLAEYDSDNVGDLDEECEDIGVEGQPLEDNAKLEAIMDEFLTEKRDEIFMEGTRHLPENRKAGGSGYSVLVGKKMFNEKELTEDIEEKLTMEENKDNQTVDKVLAEADQILANPEVEPPPEEILIDGKSYLTDKPRNPWDCESILSTYSNLDNNPITIGKSKRRGKKKKKNDKNGAVVPEDEAVETADQHHHVQILLSNKTGLPIQQEEHQPEYDYYGGDGGDGNETYMSVNKGEARNKTESAAEKKARKQLVKEGRKEARMRKKMMKEAFKEEFIKRNEDVVADDVGGTSVFRYS